MHAVCTNKMSEEPLYLNLNPVFSLWPKPLLADEYCLQDKVWVIKEGTVKRYLMNHIDKTDVKNYRIQGFLRQA